MELYVFKHHRSKTAYVRLVRQGKRIPVGKMRESWLYGTLQIALSSRTYVDGNKPHLYQHILKHGLLIGRLPMSGRNRNPDWRNEWEMELHCGTVTHEDVHRVGGELVRSLIEQGWFLLNDTVRWTRNLDQTLKEAKENLEPVV